MTIPATYLPYLQTPNGFFSMACVCAPVGVHRPCLVRQGIITKESTARWSEEYLVDAGFGREGGMLPGTFNSQGKTRQQLH